jgi:nucleoside-diphosphate-sugar epimerase
MKVFIAGATGVLGRRVVRQLIAHGHQVVGLCRSVRNREWLDSQGAVPRKGSLFNLDQLEQISADCEVTLHLATSIPTKSRTTARDWALNDRIRRDGTANLVNAALRNNHEFYLQQSVTLLYGDRGGEWVDESADLPKEQFDLVQSAVDMEGIVQQAGKDGLPATILRMGRFYSYDSAHTQAMFQMVGKRIFPVIGQGDYFWHLINVDDAAYAVVKAVEARQACIGKTFNVCDDEPVLFDTYLKFVAEILGARSPMHIPVWLARVMLGASTVETLIASTRCLNHRFKSSTGWQPEYPTCRAGIPAEINKWQSRNASPSYSQATTSSLHAPRHNLSSSQEED